MQFRRKKLLKVFIFVLSLSYAFIFSHPGSAIPKTLYDGKTLKVLSFRDNHSDAVKKNLKEFEKATGAKVVFDAIASSTVAAKTATDQLAGGSYDLYTVDEPFMPKLSMFFRKFNDWPDSKVFPSQKSQLENYLPPAIAGGSYLGEQYGLPINGNVYMYTYRKDLFSSETEKKSFKDRYGYDLDVPKTMEQFRDVAEHFTRPPKMYGFAPFSKKSEGTTVEAIWILSSFGVEFFNEKGDLVFDENRAAKAFEFYSSLMAFAPRGAKSWHHAERMAGYSSGKIAQIMTWPSFVKGLEDPQKSLVVGKNAYAVPPYEKLGTSSPVAGTWTLAMSKTSKNPSLAAEFASWWTARTNAERLVDAGMNPVRIDVLSDKKLQEKYPYFSGVLENFKVAKVRPRFPAYKEVSDRISVHFTSVLAGQSKPSEAALKLKQDLIDLSKTLKMSKK